ncbi:unnamed protein product [Cuscuta campestris]|uniref:Uncharacterized protein n=1 Tax=Cuscuta campestris TaxID=132261 RepID=A0A484MFT9_9ASTE|nr:unnamed protein product [Cuscuta campestris]
MTVRAMEYIFPGTSSREIAGSSPQLPKLPPSMENPVSRLKIGKQPILGRRTFSRCRTKFPPPDLRHRPPQMGPKPEPISQSTPRLRRPEFQPSCSSPPDPALHDSLPLYEHQDLLPRPPGKPLRRENEQRKIRRKKRRRKARRRRMG